MSVSRFLFVVVFVACLSGCGGFIKTEVSSFHEMPQNLIGSKFFIFPCEETDSLECSHYLGLIKRKLIEKGMIESDIENSDYYFFVKYNINGKIVKTYEPIKRQTGIASSQTFGTLNSFGSWGTYSATTYNYPSYEVVGTKEKEELKGYIRHLYVEVYVQGKENRAVPEKIFEGSAVSEGSKGELSLVMPAIIDSMFENFPGVSGETKTVVRKR